MDRLKPAHRFRSPSGTLQALPAAGSFPPQPRYAGPAGFLSPAKRSRALDKSNGDLNAAAVELSG